MDYETYMKEAAALRANMERPMKPYCQSTVTSLHQSQFLPGGEAKTTRVRQRPEDAEDLSWMNPPWVKPKRKNGRKPGKGRNL